MVNSNEILTAINISLTKEFSNYPVYVNGTPKDFIRPSFLLQHVRTDIDDVSRTVVEKSVYFTITCFTPTNKHHQSDADEISKLQDAVLQLFLTGYIPVGDRAIKVKGSTGGTDVDRAYIDLQFEYFDTRNDEVDTTPLMGTVTTNFKEG